MAFLTCNLDALTSEVPESCTSGPGIKLYTTVQQLLLGTLLTLDVTPYDLDDLKTRIMA
jgi:hypothetical protein